MKTVSLKTEAYERLRSARRYPGDSFALIALTGILAKVDFAQFQRERAEESVRIIARQLG